MDENFDYRKLSFVQEACGRQQEEHLISAQSTVNNARRSSLQAGFNLFATNLANDQVMQDKYLATADMTSARARSVLVHSLEAGVQKVIVLGLYSKLVQYCILITTHWQVGEHLENFYVS